MRAGGGRRAGLFSLTPVQKAALRLRLFDLFCEGKRKVSKGLMSGRAACNVLVIREDIRCFNVCGAFLSTNCVPSSLSPPTSSLSQPPSLTPSPLSFPAPTKEGTGMIVAVVINWGFPVKSLAKSLSRDVENIFKAYPQGFVGVN